MRVMIFLTCITITVARIGYFHLLMKNRKSCFALWDQYRRRWSCEATRCKLILDPGGHGWCLRRLLCFCHPVGLHMKSGVLTCHFITCEHPPIPWDYRVSGAPRGTLLKSCLHVHLGPGAIALNCLLLFALVNHPTLPLKLSHVWLWPLSFSHLCYGF